MKGCLQRKTGISLPGQEKTSFSPVYIQGFFLESIIALIILICVG